MRLSLLLLPSVLVQISFATQIAFNNLDADNLFGGGQPHIANPESGASVGSHSRRPGVPITGCSSRWITSCDEKLDAEANSDSFAIPKAQLAYLHTCVGALVNVAGFHPSTKIKALRTIIHTTAYSAAELTELDSAMVQYLEFKSSRFALTPPDATAESTLARADIDINWLSKIDIYVLHSLIGALNKRSTDLDTQAKKEVLGWCTSLVALPPKKMKTILKALDVSSSPEEGATKTRLTPTTPISPVQIPLGLKANLKARVEGLTAGVGLQTKIKLQPVLRLCIVWINGDLALLTSLGVNGLDDSSIFAKIVTLLDDCGYADVVQALKDEFSEAGVMID